MKRLLCVILLFSLLLAGCAGKKQEDSTTSTEPSEPVFLTPQELFGSWSATGENPEVITFFESGEVQVTSTVYNLYGTFTVEDDTLSCEFTEGDLSEPFRRSYNYRIDGRELYLSDENGDVQYLRVS